MAPRRRSSRRCSNAACASSTSRRTSACAMSRPTSSWYGAASASRAARARRLRPDRVLPRADRRRRARRLPGLLPDRGDPRARAAGAAGLHRRRRDRRQDRRLRGRQAARREATHFVAVAENVRPYGVGAHRHMPEIDQELGSARRPGPASSRRTCSRIDQGELLSCYVTPTRAALAGRSSRSSTPRATTTSPSSSSSRARRACATCARPISARSRPRRRAHGQALRLRGDRQPLEGHRIAGRRQPQPDVRLRRGDGSAVIRRASSAPAGCRAPGARGDARRAAQRASASPACRVRARGGGSPELDLGLLVSRRAGPSARCASATPGSSRRRCC